MLNWSTHLLTEYFAAVNAAENEHDAISNAVERAVEMVEGERRAEDAKARAEMPRVVVRCEGRGDAVEDGRGAAH